MAKKKLVIEIEFDEISEDDYTYLEFAKMKVKSSKTTASEDELKSLAESWAQSDWYWVGFCNSFVNMLDGKPVEASDVKSY